MRLLSTASQPTRLFSICILVGGSAPWLWAYSGCHLLLWLSLLHRVTPTIPKCVLAVEQTCAFVATVDIVVKPATTTAARPGRHCNKAARLAACLPHPLLLSCFICHDRTRHIVAHTRASGSSSRGRRVEAVWMGWLSHYPGIAIERLERPEKRHSCRHGSFNAFNRYRSLLRCDIMRFYSRDASVSVALSMSGSWCRRLPASDVSISVSMGGGVKYLRATAVSQILSPHSVSPLHLPLRPSLIFRLHSRPKFLLGLLSFVSRLVLLPLPSLRHLLALFGWPTLPLPLLFSLSVSVPLSTRLLCGHTLRPSPLPLQPLNHVFPRAIDCDISDSQTFYFRETMS